MIAEIEDSPYSKTYTAPDRKAAEYSSFKKWQAGKLASGNIAVVNTVQTRYNIGEKYSNIEVREFYISQIEQIQNIIDRTLPLEEQARSAFNQRNEIRTYARDLMNDE